MKIIIIDDDADNRRQFKELCESEFPNASVKAFEDIFDSLDAASDVVLIDISSICPYMLNIESAYSPICSYADRHPGCSVLIHSAVSASSAQDLIDKVAEVSGVKCHYAGWGDWGLIKAKIIEVTKG